jgi:hypothetical protein
VNQTPYRGRSGTETFGELECGVQVVHFKFLRVTLTCRGVVISAAGELVAGPASADLPANRMGPRSV